MNLPLVSIIIPSYNTSIYLKSMLDTIISQTYSNWELIIVDDISTDNTIEMVSKYLNKDARIRLIQRDRLPKGAQTCRNIGYQKSKGKYVVFFDSDDLISNFCLDQRVRFMEENQNIDFGIFPAHTFTVKNNTTINHLESNFGVYSGTDANVLTSFLEAQYKFTVWTNIYKRDSINNISWDENVAVLQDFDFIMQTLLSNKTFAFCKTAKFDYFYRCFYNENSISSNFVSDKKCSSTIYLFSKTLDALNEKEDHKIRKKEFLHFIVLHFERLVMDGSKVKLDDYLEFLKKYYSRDKLISLKGISKISLKCSNLKIRKALMYLLLGVRFGYLNYLKILFVQLKIKKIKKNN